MRNQQSKVMLFDLVYAIKVIFLIFLTLKMLEYLLPELFESQTDKETHPLTQEIQRHCRQTQAGQQGNWQEGRAAVDAAQ